MGASPAMPDNSGTMDQAPFDRDVDADGNVVRNPPPAISPTGVAISFASSAAEEPKATPVPAGYDSGVKPFVMPARGVHPIPPHVEIREQVADKLDEIVEWALAQGLSHRQIQQALDGATARVHDAALALRHSSRTPPAAIPIPTP